MPTGDELALAFEQANQTAISAMERLRPADLRRTTSDGWTVAVAARHIARCNELLGTAMRDIASGAGLPAMTPHDIDERNAGWAGEDAGADLAETIELMRTSGVEVAAMLRSLSGDELGCIATLLGTELTAGQFAEGILIRHVNGHHLEAIKAVVRQPDS